MDPAVDDEDDDKSLNYNDLFNHTKPEEKIIRWNECVNRYVFYVEKVDIMDLTMFLGVPKKSYVGKFN